MQPAIIEKLTLVTAIFNFIILISATVIAVSNIASAMGKPIKFFEKRRKQKFKENLMEELPPILEEHDLKTREKYKADCEEYLEDIKASILSDIKKDIKEIKDLNIMQSAQIEILNSSSQDILREKIMTIYERNRKQRKMFEYERRQLKKYYEDYKKEKGNTYIEDYYHLMEKWETIPDES